MKSETSGKQTSECTKPDDATRIRMSLQAVAR